MKRVVVVGNGMVGYKFCEKLRKKASHEAFSVTVFGEECRPAYDRVRLSAWFSGTSVDELTLAPAQWYAENQVDLRCGELVTHIDREQRVLRTHRGTEVSYDYLVLATGSAAFVPPVPGVEKRGVFVYRTIEDLEAISAFGKDCRRAAVMGGGLLGLEAAKAVLDMGLEPHVVELAPRLMPRQLDQAGSDALQSRLEALGIHIHLGKQTKEITGNGHLDALVFGDGTQLDVDMLVISAGIKPRDELARQFGLAVGPRGGVVVDDHMRTSDSHIYAIGEVALHEGMIYGLVAPGYAMAETVVDHLLGESKPFQSTDLSTKLKLIGVDVASFGDAFAETEPSTPIIFQNAREGLYQRLNLSADGKRLLGGILVGDAGAYGQLSALAKSGATLPPHPEDLLLGPRGGGEGSASQGVENLPDDVTVCSCENVTKGMLCSAVKDGTAQSVGDLKKCTKAGTGCGGCMPMVTDLYHTTLASMGKRVRKVICEHLDYTRQELFDLIHIKEIRSYDDLLTQYGKGDGCEVCKPAVASILASLWNDPILLQDTIQDSNDRYLANIQRGGTYSVVPRIAGGEITPDKLIVIGQVAKKYGLYTKITGGQRIDLFGARLDQLPDIWEELIHAGFESGHAYGKSLRTVKSCVGSTWCRYGLHDSVSFAIEIENRYKGLRSPHKLKSAVSGCIRECAEAQSKDFGIIATEKGWNLFVGGNGGAKPQHAQILARDVDKETCIRYIDRFLMFYIKTAEPLMRTATWLNKLDGGLEYLRDVVVNDCLGIGEELERMMAQTLEVYKCEWKEVVENPELRARFTHFVNADEPDPTLAYVPMRDQKIPAKGAW
ncbi:nitrite reductase (NADH) large subunit [Catalinimonas alkaloidigena]|uniref:Nitrite reductase (NADH) large subunit n=1 Tax=Catalinimonas alkaloidigena TaxID=1075417 RepID=A0A1G9R6K7_9BACT|nr:nitrite reductase large subunit NirB [Catalinimonas alkaloidigena]SDM18760.1 nitrite reductase (NADH) large subunit [Catalinimonas alkaloidigena]